MARRGDLAGLAALGALGYMLTRDDKKKAPVEDRIGTPVTRDIPAADTDRKSTRLNSSHT